MDGLFWVKAVVVAGACVLAGTAAADVPVYTVDQLRNAGIAAFVGRTLVLRAGFKPEMLANPAFVKQCNDPRYWAQTFELEIAAVTP